MKTKIIFLLGIVLLITVNIYGQQVWYETGFINPNYSYSVSLSDDGSVIAVGSSYRDLTDPWGWETFADDDGFVRIYQNISGNWNQIGNDILSENTNDASGFCLDLSSDGTTVIIGAPQNDGNGNNSGHARVFRNVSGNWEQIGSDIDGEAANDNFGYSVSINYDGSIIAVGSRLGDSGKGYVKIYKNISNIWTQIGSTITGENQNDWLGTSLSLNDDGTIITIGATGIGEVKTFKNISNVWTQIGNSITGSNSNFGVSVDINSDGTIIAIGEDYYDMSKGKVVVYQNISNVWTQIGNEIYGDSGDDYFGHSVSINSNGTIIGAGSPNHNYVKTYQNISGNWEQLGTTITNDDAQVSPYYGVSVCISSDGYSIAIGSSNSTYIYGLSETCVSQSEISLYECESYISPSGKIYTESGVYMDTILNQVGCDSIITINLFIQKPYQDQQLCLVSVDPITGKNKVVWEGTPNVGTKSYIIYKALSSNNYSAIAVVDASEPNEYIDYGSDPMAHSDFYKMTILDTCNNESDITNAIEHKTINLTLSNVGSTMSLNWEQYEGFVPARYYIYRGTSSSNLQVIDSVNGLLSSYNDIGVVQVYYYMVGTIRQDCGENAKSLSTSYSILSNKKDNKDLISVPEILGYLPLKIFPNPAINQIQISGIENIRNIEVIITDITGKRINQTFFSERNEKSLRTDISSLKSGVYFIIIKTDKIYRGKFVKN